MPPAKRSRASEGSVTVRIHRKERDDYDEEDEEDFFDEDDDDLGYQGDYECTRSFGGDVLVDSLKVGSFRAHIVDRQRAGSIFHSACDAESAELQEMGCVLFSSNGNPRYPALKSDASVQRGGFVYIDSFELNAEYRTDGATDIGAAAIRALLSCPELAGRWTVASYIADSDSCLSDAEVAADRERQRAMFHGAPPETLEEKTRRIAGVHERMAKDARQFVRAGFAEMAYKDGGWLYMTKRMMQSPLTTHAAALAVPLRLTGAAAAAGAASPSAARVGLTDADDRLLQELRGDSGATDASVLAAVDRLVAEGADLTRAGVLQFCAVNDKKDLLQPMLSRGAQINGKDGQSGTTALMMAASRIPGRTSRHQPQHDFTMVATLIALGADKNVVDDDGCSALGHYFKALRSTNDFGATFGLGPKQKVDPTLRTMLTPAGGPTAADMSCADDH